MTRLALLITAPYRLLGRVLADALAGPDELEGRIWPDTTAGFEHDHTGQLRLPATPCPRGWNCTGHGSDGEGQ